MIKVISGILISITLSLGLTAQTEFTYFNKVYNPNALMNNMLSTNVLEVEGGYLIAGIYSDTSNRYLYMRKIDYKGNSIWLKHIDEGFELEALTTGNMLIKSQYENEIILIYDKDKEVGGSVGNLHLVRFDAECGEKIWETVIDDEKNRNPYAVLETDNLEFVVCGTSTDPGVFNQIYVSRFDFIGNQLWEKQFGYSALSSGVVQDKEGFIYVSGYVFNEETNFDPYLIKLTEQGDSLWTRTYGGNGDDCGGRISFLPSGNILFHACYEIDWDYQMFMVEVTPDGDTIWEKVFLDSGDRERYQTNIHIVQNPFVTITRGIRFDKNQYGNWANTWMEVNLTTKQVFKEIDIPLNPQKDSYIKDMERTSDGGYILCGFQYTSPQLSWVVKTDSLGNTCKTIGCDSTVIITDIEEPELLVQEYAVYPNPVYVGEELFIESPALGAETFYLIDIMGRLVDELEVYGKHSINTQDLPSGAYVLKNETGTWSEKIVIIR